MIIPPLLIRNVTENWPRLGPAWLGELPALIAALCEEWNLTITQEHRMTFHWVASVARRDGSPAVLKLGVPDGHLSDEATALRLFDGSSAVTLLDDDLSRGAILLEKAFPGTPLALVELSDAAATTVLREAARTLHREPPPDCPLPHLRTFRDALVRFPPDGALPQHMVSRALSLFDDLCASSPGDVVLHGDLHHENVLSATRRPWLVIDPFGLIGDPGWDVGAMLYNPYPERRDPALLDLVPARVEEFSDRELAWGFVASVLSEAWSVTTNGGVNTRAFDVATLLESRLRD